MSAEGLTCDQVKAISPDANIWVAASAGTGKTHILTARLLRLMLDGVSPERLLCLTFTRAAAAQMASRLREILGEWTRLSDTALDADLYSRCGLRADEHMRTRARTLLAGVLDLPNGMRIYTIHAFCQSLLGRFPIEAGLSPQFRLVDEQQARELLLAARDRVIDEARKPGRQRLADAFDIIAGEVNENDFGKLVSALIGERRLLTRLLDPKGGYGGLEPLLAATARALEIDPDADDETVIESALRPPALDEDRIRHLADLLGRYGTASEKGKAADLHRLLAAPPARRIDFFAAWRKVFLTAGGDARSTTKWPTRAVKAADSSLVGLVDDEAARLIALDDRLRSVRVLGFTRAALTVGKAISHHYEDEKRRAALLDYDDLVLATMELLSEEGIAPWILYKLDAGIDHILVDEAQDTNSEQWAIIEALAAEFHSGETARAAGRTLFAVGDLKQSIYGFQGAEPEAFIAARRHVFERCAGVGAKHETVSLDRSFRSTKPVLALVDAVFASEEASKGLKLDGRPISHIANRDSDAGLVELWPLEQSEQAKRGVPWEPPVTRQPGATAEARLAVRIADHIAAMVGSDSLESRGRPVRAGDILVLVRRRTAFVDLLVKALKARNVPVAGSDRLEVSAHIAVRDLLAIGAVSLLPEDDLTLATVLKGPLVAISEDDLFRLAHGRGRRSLWSALNAVAGDDPIFAGALERLSGIRRRADQVPPFEFFTGLLSAGGLRRAFAARLGDEVHDPLDEFLTLCRAYEREHPPSLQGFLHWIGRRGSEIKREQDTVQRDVRIMTVHGAKGLEAPIVYLPDCASTPTARQTLHRIAAGKPAMANPDLPLLVWRGNSADNERGPVAEASAAMAAREDEEYRRLLYVALTRAQDRLYIAGWSNQSTQKGSWYDLISEGFSRLPGVEEEARADGAMLRRLTSPQLDRADTIMEEPPLDEGLALPDWLNQPAPPEPTPPRPLAPSSLGEEPAAAGPFRKGSAEMLQRGRLVHLLLQHLPETAPARREVQALAFLAREGLGDDAAKALYRDVARILADPEFAPLFGEGSLAEAPIAGTIGPHVISARLDRLLIAPDRILVVDYKTNADPPSSPGAVPQTYLRQMAAYRALLRRIWCDRPVRCALLWTAVPRLMILENTLLERHAVLFEESPT